MDEKGRGGLGESCAIFSRLPPTRRACSQACTDRWLEINQLKKYKYSKTLSTFSSNRFYAIKLNRVNVNWGFI